MAAETPRQRLARVKAYVLTVEFQLRDDGSKYLGMIQTYSDQQVAREFTDRFNALQEAMKIVGAAVSKALARSDTPDSVLTALADENTKLGNAIRDFNRSSWWVAPSKARTLVEIPFQVAAHVVVRVGTIVTDAGQSLVSGLTFASKNLVPLLVVGAILYWGVPWALKMRKAVRS